MLVRPQPKQITGFVIGVIAIVYLTDFELGRFNAGLDNSWIAVMAWAAAKPLQFGPDIVFTNGPLGYLLYPINFPAVYWPALFLRLAANILLVAMLFVLSGRLPLWHVDAYRLGGSAELDDLDLDTDLSSAVVVVEWGEGMAEGLAVSHLLVQLRRRGAAEDGGEDESRVATVLRVEP